VKNDNDHMEHKLHEAIRAQLFLLDNMALKEVLKLTTELACPEYYKQVQTNF